MGENAEDGVGGEAAAQLEQHQRGGEQEADRDRRDGEVEREQRAEPDPEQRAVRERIAEVGHAAPHHEAAERPGDRGDADPAEDRAHQEIIEHRRRFGPVREIWAIAWRSVGGNATTSPARSWAWSWSWV